NFFGKKIYFRGIIEFSNVCAKDCGYCGIRKHMPAEHVRRYTMTKEEILAGANFAYENGYGSLMLQSGELPNEKRLAFLADVVREIKRVTIARDEEKQQRNKHAQTTTTTPNEVAKIANEMNEENPAQMSVAGGYC